MLCWINLLIWNASLKTLCVYFHKATRISQLAWQRTNVTTTERDGIYCAYMRLCDIQIKVEERRIRWGDQEIEEAKVQTVTFGSPCNSPNEIHYHPQQINKERDCLALTDRCSQCRWRIWDWQQLCHPSAANAQLCVCVFLQQYLLKCVAFKRKAARLSKTYSPASRQDSYGKGWNLRVMKDSPSSLLWGSAASCCPITCQSPGTAA